jgi:hypothetical protein
MATVRKTEDGLFDDIDMERVVTDPDYRRRVIGLLRRERVLAQAQQDGAAEDSAGEEAGEED